MGQSADERRARKAILSAWHAAGRPPCPVCQTVIEQGDNVRVSHLWKAVVHPFCVQARVGRPSQLELNRGACPCFPDCPIPFHGRSSDYCVCPIVAAINLIVLARRFGEPTVEVPTVPGSAIERAARQAVPGQHYHGVPPRENPSFDRFRKHGVLAPGVDESIWNQPANWYAAPEYLTVDVDRTIREGCVVAARPDHHPMTEPRLDSSEP